MGERFRLRKHWILKAQSRIQDKRWTFYVFSHFVKNLDFRVNQFEEWKISIFQIAILYMIIIIPQCVKLTLYYPVSLEFSVEGDVISELDWSNFKFFDTLQVQNFVISSRTSQKCNQRCIKPFYRICHALKLLWRG